MRRLLFLIALLHCVGPALAANCLSNGTGNWNATGTWTGCTGGNGTPANTPGSNDNATIRNGNTVTLTAAANALTVTISSAAGNNTNSLLSVAGQTLTIGALGTGALSINGGAGARTAEIRLSTGTVKAGNVSVSGGTARITFTAGGTMEVKGNLQSGATFTAATGTVNFLGSAAQSIGAYTYNILEVNNNVGASLTAATTAGTVTIGDQVPASIFNDAGFQLTSTGVLNLTSGTFKLGEAASATSYPAFATNTIGAGTTVEYVAGPNGQSVSTTPTYQNLTFSGAGSKTVAAGTLTVAGTWTAGAAARLDIFNAAVSLTGDLTGAGSITQGTGAISAAGNWLNTGTFTAGTGVVTLTGSGKQITGNASGISFGTLTVNGTYTNNNPDTTNGITVTSALSGIGTLTQGSNAVLTLGGSSGISTIDATSNTPNTITYNGAAGQTVKAMTYHHLTNANTSGLTLAGNAIVNGTFTFSGTSGGLNTGASTLTIGSSGSVSGAGAARHVVGDLAKAYAAAGSFTYDVGDGTNYTPATVNFSSLGTVGSLTCSVKNTDHPDTTLSASGIDPTLSVNRYWTLKSSTLAGTYSLTLNNPSTDLDAGATAANFIIRRGAGCTGSGGTRTCSSWSGTTLSGTPTTTQAAASGLTVANGDPESDFAVGERLSITFSRESEFIYSRELY